MLCLEVRGDVDSNREDVGKRTVLIDTKFWEDSFIWDPSYLTKEDIVGG